MSVIFKYCPLFKQTHKQQTEALPGLAKKVEAFINAKAADPLSAFGNKDTQMNSKAPLGSAVPKLKHVHLTKDISLFYTISGANTIEFKLYGIFTHKDTGTGDSPNLRTQQALAKKLASQSFSQ
jgi:hypothetical protein